MDKPNIQDILRCETLFPFLLLLARFNWKKSGYSFFFFSKAACSILLKIRLTLLLSFIFSPCSMFIKAQHHFQLCRPTHIFIFLVLLQLMRMTVFAPDARVSQEMQMQVQVQCHTRLPFFSRGIFFHSPPAMAFSGRFTCWRKLKLWTWSLNFTCCTLCHFVKVATTEYSHKLFSMRYFGGNNSENVLPL